MKTLINLILIILLMITIVGCNSPSGKVIEKAFIPAHTTTDLVSSFDADGNVSFYTVDSYIPDRWCITVKNDEYINQVYITQEEYDRLNIGDFYGLEK